MQLKHLLIPTNRGFLQLLVLFLLVLGSSSQVQQNTRPGTYYSPPQYRRHVNPRQAASVPAILPGRPDNLPRCATTVPTSACPNPIPSHFTSSEDEAASILKVCERLSTLEAKLEELGGSIRQLTAEQKSFQIQMTQTVGQVKHENDNQPPPASTRVPDAYYAEGGGRNRNELSKDLLLGLERKIDHMILESKVQVDQLSRTISEAFSMLSNPFV